MFRKTAIVFALAGATALTPVAFAASQDASSTHDSAMTNDQQASQTDQQTSKDFQKLSEDGFQAFRNVQMARLAIFEGETDQAKQLVDQAAQRLQTAKSDGTAFEKSHAELMQQAMASQSDHSTKGQDAAKTDEATPANAAGSDRKADSGQASDPSSKTASNTGGADDRTLWLPIDGQVLVGEDYQAAQQQDAARKMSSNDQDAAAKQKDAMAKANQAIQSGDKETAREQLQLAGVDVDFAVALVPLDQVTQDVGHAQSDLNDGKFYEASQDLKKVQDAIVIAAVDEIGVPDQGKSDQSASNEAPAKASHDQQVSNERTGQGSVSQQSSSQSK